ncbi:hypothetical protein MKW98_023144 [Papaver atlanticum]|uniref:2-methoxy-6-polyprenyl-1,4-benzoquinol methylase, mitochondrial n=1 Tax=Papaver atlanticum TaxID=357466 RepID=A0AAD4T7X2_9MAGN|nr:hypothetical protein MKW98_023144 [Papaver atlanticum]
MKDKAFLKERREGSMTNTQRDKREQKFNYYSFSVIPAVGELVAGDWKSYQYLIESIRKFPRQEMFARMIADVGFQKVEYENLVGGVVAIHSGFKHNILKIDHLLRWHLYPPAYSIQPQLLPGMRPGVAPNFTVPYPLQRQGCLDKEWVRGELGTQGSRYCNSNIS